MEVALPSRVRFGAFELDLKAGEVCKGNSTTFKDSLGIGICEKL